MQQGDELDIWFNTPWYYNEPGALCYRGEGTLALT